MIKWEIFLQKEFAINKEGTSDIKNREISLICENTPYFKKKNMKIWLQRVGVSH
jgi:hypothetical protein